MFRLFIAINLPENIKEKIGDVLREIQEENPQLKKIARWTTQENWHFTLVFLGYQPNESVPVIRRAMEEARKDLREVKIEFKWLDYGPIGDLPRMVWLTATKETESALSKIKNKLEEKLLENKISWGRESRPFRAHLTLARFLPKPLKDLPKIREEVFLDFSVRSIFLMKSTLKPSGAVYESLFQVDF